MNKESKRRGDWESPLERKGLKGFPPINHDRTRATKMMHRRSFISLNIFHRYGETLMISLFFFSSPSVNTFSSANSTLLSCFARNSGWIRPTRWFLSLESEGMLWMLEEGKRMNEVKTRTPDRQLGSSIEFNESISRLAFLDDQTRGKWSLEVEVGDKLAPSRR